MALPVNVENQSLVEKDTPEIGMAPRGRVMNAHARASPPSVRLQKRCRSREP